MGDSFTGQKTQPTVSTVLKEKNATKEKLEKANNTKYSNTIKSHTYKHNKSTSLH